MTYRPGDFYRICDRCGAKKRASETAKEWNNLMVCTDGCFEERHPQDFVRGRVDRQRVPDPRPEPTMTLIGPLTTVTTAAANPGATSLSVESSIRMEAGDDIGVMLARGDVHRAVIDTVASSTSLTLTSATKLPDSVASGALIIDYDAVAEADIG